MKKTVLSIFAAAALMAQAVNFIPGNIVVSKVGNGTLTVASGGVSVPVTLEEYNTTTADQTTPVQAFPLNADPSSTALTLGGLAGEGQISLSKDNRFITVLGYNSAINVVAATAGAVTGHRSLNKSVAKIDNAGNITYYNLAVGSGQASKNTVSTDGSNFWNAIGNVGISYFSDPGTITPLVIGASGTFYRSMEIFNNKVYLLTGTNDLLYSNSDLPTAAASATNTLTMPDGGAATSGYGFVFLNSGSGNSWNGYDLLYVADINGGLRKLYYNGTAWVFVSKTSDNTIYGSWGIHSLAGRIENGKPALYTTAGNGTKVANKIFKMVDNQPYNEVMSTVTYTTIATAPANYSFKGVAFAPQIVPSAPTAIAVAPGNTQLSVSFTTPTNDGGSAITNYKYSTDGGATFTTCSPVQTTSPILITGLTNETLYNVQIKAINTNGDGTSSQIKSGTPSNTTGFDNSTLSNLKVIKVNGGLSIQSAKNESYKIMNTVGQLIARGVCTSDNEFVSLKNKGIVLVQVNKQVTKVLLTN